MMFKRNRFAKVFIATWLCSRLGCARVGTPTSPTTREAKLHVDFLDVEHGDTALITSPTGRTVLIDGGLEEASPSIVSALRSRNPCPLDLISPTHRHSDHLSGLVHVIVRDAPGRLCTSEDGSLPRKRLSKRHVFGPVAQVDRATVS